MDDRFLKLVNFRDLGGITAADGRKTIHKRLLRSGEPVDLTKEEIRLLCEEYHLLNIADLRTKNEKTMSPDSVILGTHYFEFDFFPGQALKKADCSEDQFEKVKSIEQLHEDMVKTYESFITDELVRIAISDFLQLLLCTKDSATLFHCFAGKDRTGITAAVTLTILGVSKSDIMKDYLDTNAFRQKANDVMIEHMRKEGKPEQVLEIMRAALCVEQRYLEASYKTAIQEYGSFEEYIINGIGFGKADWEKLRSLYLN